MLSNKELKNKIAEYRTITMSIYNNEPPMLLHCLTDEELLSLIKEVLESVIPKKKIKIDKSFDIENIGYAQGYNYALFEMKDNLEKLLKE